MWFLPAGCKTWEKETTGLSEWLLQHLTRARAGGCALMKWPLNVFSACGPNYWCLCTNPCSPDKPGGEAGHTCTSCGTQPQVLVRTGRIVRYPFPRCVRYPAPDYTHLCPTPHALLLGKNLPSASMRVMPGPISWILGRFRQFA